MDQQNNVRKTLVDFRNQLDESQVPFYAVVFIIGGSIVVAAVVTGAMYSHSVFPSLVVIAITAIAMFAAQKKMVRDPMDIVIGSYIAAVRKSKMSGDDLLNEKLLPDEEMLGKFTNYSDGMRQSMDNALFIGLSRLNFTTEETNISDEYKGTVKWIKLAKNAENLRRASQRNHHITSPVDLFLTKENSYTAKFEELRKKCFPDHVSNYYDSYNDKSDFLVFKDKADNLIAVLRISPNPDGALITQTKSAGDFRNDADTVDFCNAMVKPDYRMNGIFELLILAGLAYAYKSGKRYVNGAVVKGTLRDRMSGLYFDMDFPRVKSNEPYGNTKSVIPIRCDLEKSIEDIKYKLDDYVDYLVDYGIRVERKGLDELVF